MDERCNAIFWYRKLGIENKWRVQIQSLGLHFFLALQNRMVINITKKIRQTKSYVYIT